MILLLINSQCIRVCILRSIIPILSRFGYFKEIFFIFCVFPEGDDKRSKEMVQQICPILANDSKCFNESVKLFRVTL